MANVKNKVNTPKNKSPKSNRSGKVGRPKKSVINIKNKKNEPTQVSKCLKTRVNYEEILKLGVTSTKQGEKIDTLRSFKIPKKKSLSKNSPKERKITPDINLIDNILKSELLIKETHQKDSDTGKNNNNNEIHSNQNKDVTDSVPIDDLSSFEIKRKKNPIKKKDLESIIKLKHEMIPLKKNRIYECDYCRKQFNKRASIRRHLLLHEEFDPFTCSQCKKVFRSQLYLSAHIKDQHPNWAAHYMCTMCDRPFLTKENLTAHMLTHSSHQSVYRCIYCKDEYDDQQDLIEHEKQHLVDGKYQCIICDMSFKCRNKVTLHYKSHLGVKEFICHFCGKEFLRRNSMRRHVRICHRGVRIQCSVCKKYLKGHLTEHMRTHEKERPHKCPDCGQRFTQSTQLTVHRRSHTGARPYPCRICDRPFTHSNALMLHIRRHTGEKPFPCAMCPISFSQLPHMKAHMRNIHGKLLPYKCEKCKKFFKLKAELENHAKGCTNKGKELSQELQDKKSAETDEDESQSTMSISRMRFLLALLLTMIASKEKLKYLGFNKRLIDDLLVESLEAMGYAPCKDASVTPIKRLRTNIQLLLNGTVPEEKMEKFKKESKTTEELLELLTNEKK